MTARLITPVKGPLDSIVRVPGSKSIANRALVCAALAQGTSVLHNVADGDDTLAMLECLDALGIAASCEAGVVTITGCAGSLARGPAVLSARLAGTTSRFITALAALGPGPYTIDGEPALRTRPMRPLHDALALLGAHVEHRGAPGHLPVTVSGPLRGNAAVTIRGDVSSQFITALMLIGPFVPGGVHVVLSTPLVSRPYVEMTAAVMAAFGHLDVTIRPASITVGPGEYHGCQYEVEADASSASYPLAAAAICGGRVTVPGLGDGALQGDATFADLLATMGCAAERTATATTVVGHGALTGIDVDMVDHSDLVPTLAAVALFATTPTRVRGVGFIRAKESDRLGDLCTELTRLGADAVEEADGLSIRPAALSGGRLDTHDDHRLAMAFGVIGLRVAGVSIAAPGVVSKSWPGYWEMLEALR